MDVNQNMTLEFTIMIHLLLTNLPDDSLSKDVPEAGETVSRIYFFLNKQKYSLHIFREYRYKIFNSENVKGPFLR